MRPGPHDLGRAGAALARERLAAYRRYAELVARQEEALDADDLARFEELAREVSDLQQEIGSATPPMDVLRRDEAAAEVVAALEEATARTRRMTQRLRALRDTAGQDVRAALTRRPQARRYVSEPGQEGRVTGPTRLDVKL